MKKVLFSFAMGIMATVGANAQSTVWNLDKSHSAVNFNVDHLVVSEVSGKFDDFSVDIKADKPDFSDVAFSFAAKVATVNTADEKRDGHLKSPDFFDAAKFPEITFKGTKFTKTKGNEYKVVGDLTMHGVTKTVALTGKFGGIVKDPWGGTRAGIKVTGEIDRYEFGLKYNSVLEAGGLSIGQKVRISVNLELIKKG